MGGMDGPVVLHRHDRARNMARHYTLSVEVTLFDDWSCTRTFGRIGAREARLMIGLYPTREAAREALRELLRRKLKRGYRPVDAMPE
jgi:predicted DNA-binding WGR domain protein